MSDHCKFCTLCGHIRACEGTDCDIHENWYAQTLKKQAEAIPELVEAAKAFLECSSYAEHKTTCLEKCQRLEAALAKMEEVKP